MLDFANRPPQGPEDISLSETGKVILESAYTTEQLHALGNSACSEIVDAYGEAGPPRDSEGVIIFPDTVPFFVEARELLSDRDMNALLTGINQFRYDLSEVPA